MNILLDDKFTAKLGDFGFAVELPRVSCGRTMFSANFCARSEGYYAPEISTGRYSDRSDVYSYGIVSSRKCKLSMIITQKYNF